MIAKLLLIISLSSGWIIPKQWLFEALESITGTPWEYLAAIERFEKNKHSEQKHFLIQIPRHQWAGFFNPNPDDSNPLSIQLFHGIGRDGNGDHKADRTNQLDVFYSIAHYLTLNGRKEESIQRQLWEYYQQPTTVEVITHMAKILHKYGKEDLNEHVFPIPQKYHYTFRSTWGDRRGWGGTRIHEGTDIFADYGTPVLSPCYGYVELTGWNPYGGWRIGIRDMDNRYHYLAHLSSYHKGLKIGTVVKPGQVIGYVGSTGYGPPGTAGKFPPHLHYGIYKFDGEKTYSFDPYPLLKKWEKHRKRVQH